MVILEGKLCGVVELLLSNECCCENGITNTCIATKTLTAMVTRTTACSNKI